MTKVLFLPVGIPARRLPEEVLVHIRLCHGENLRESMTAYEALARLSESFFLSPKSNRRLPFLEYTKNGQPYFKDFPDISFSISHTKDMIAVAMSDNMLVGIDIEKINEEKHSVYSKIVDRSFFYEEKSLFSPKKESLSEFFLSLWTRKEAVAKVLQIPPPQVNTCCLPVGLRLQTGHVSPNFIFTLCQYKKEKKSLL